MLDSSIDLNVIKGILTLRHKTGSSISEICADYTEFTGEELHILKEDFRTAMQFLHSIPGVYYRKEQECYIWYIKSENSKHIADMIEFSKPSRQTKYQKTKIQSSENLCYFQDNQRCHSRQYLNPPPTLGSASVSSRSSGSWSSSRYSGQPPYLQQQPNQQFHQHQFNNNYHGNMMQSNFHSSRTNLHSNNQLHSNQNYYPNLMDSDAYLYEYQLLGDDFFLQFASIDLNCKTVRDKHGIMKCGYCISGQTIKDAASRLENRGNYFNANLIINIGSVDLLHGRDFIDMKYDFNRLYNACIARGISPIFTTIPPFANLNHIPDIQQRRIMFNKYLLMQFKNTVSIDTCFVSSSGHILFDCYQPVARYVSGSDQPHALWNRIGRQRVLKYIKKRIPEFFIDIAER